jgi:hypothetical protein
VTYAHPEAEAELLAALEEIGEGDGFDLDALGLAFDESLSVVGDGEAAELETPAAELETPAEEE